MSRWRGWLRWLTSWWSTRTCQRNPLKAFIALAKSRPGKLTYSSAGNGSGNHLGGEMLKSMAGIDLVHVPYKSGGPAVVAVLGGEVDACIADPLAALPHIRSGKLRALAVTSAKRGTALPDVPAHGRSRSRI
ncbi:tripartite tricarboxylate transporter substrate-binding protein [Cupriavidus basilensis]